MEIHQTISSGSVSLSGYGSTTLFLDPRDIATGSGLITKIEYIWGDGTSEIVRRKLDLSNLGDTSTYAFSGDLGDPRNVITSHVYYPTQYDTAVYEVTVKVSTSNTIEADTRVQLTLDVYRVPLFDNGSNNGYAKSIHLIANRSWGLNNKKMFILETTTPDAVYALTPRSSYTELDNSVIPPTPEIPPA